MSRLSRIVVLATAVGAVGWMAIAGGSSRVAGQNSPQAEDGTAAAERSQSTAGGETAERDAAVEPVPDESAANQAEPSDDADAWDAAAAAVRQRQANRQIEEALAKRVSFNFKKERLRDILAELARAGSFPLWIDERALEDIGASTDEALTVPFEDVTIQQALNRLLLHRGLTWFVHNEVLRVTTIEEAELVLAARVYDIGPLLDYTECHAERPRDDVLLGARFRTPPASTGLWSPLCGVDVVEPSKFAPGDWLIDTFLHFTKGPWEEIDGSGGTISTLQDVIVVRQTFAIQREVASLLDALQATARGELQHGSREVRPANYPLEADRRIHAALDQKTSLDFDEAPLHSAAVDISQRMGISIVIDAKALQDLGIDNDGPVSLDMQNVTWRSAIELMLEPLGLTAIVQDGALLITASEEAESHLFTTVYDVRDLADKGFSGERLLNAMQNETSGPWEDLDGQGGTAAIPAHGILLVRQTQGVHAEIALLLADLREHAIESEEPAAAEPLDEEDPTAVVARFYPIDPLLAAAASQEPAGETRTPVRRGRPTRTALERTVLEFVAPDTWSDSGRGPGVLEKVNNVLVVRQTVAVHRELRDFLDRLENAAATAASQQGAHLQGFSGGMGGVGGGFGGGGGLGGGGFGGGGGFFRVPAK